MTQMKTFLATIWAAVAISTGSMEDNHDIGISSGYGGAYGYFPIPKNINITKYLKSDSSTSRGFGEASRYIPAINLDSVDRHLRTSVPISSGYGGAYGYALVSTISDNIQPKKRPVEVNKHIMMSLSEAVLVNGLEIAISRSPGFSGYGNGISPHSGYSRQPAYSSFGFAYANGWL